MKKKRGADCDVGRGVWLLCFCLKRREASWLWEDERRMTDVVGGEKQRGRGILLSIYRVSIAGGDIDGI